MGHPTGPDPLADNASIAENAGQLVLNVKPSERWLQTEVDVLKKHNVSVIISLLEDHINGEMMSAHFDVHHFPIEDIDCPTRDQVYEYARVLKDEVANDQVVVTHCLAGIGRTFPTWCATSRTGSCICMTEKLTWND